MSQRGLERERFGDKIKRKQVNFYQGHFNMTSLQSGVSSPVVFPFRLVCDIRYVPSIQADAVGSQTEEASANHDTELAHASVKNVTECKETGEDESVQLSHRDAMAIWKEGLAEMIEVI